MDGYDGYEVFFSTQGKVDLSHYFSYLFISGFVSLSIQTYRIVLCSHKYTPKHWAKFSFDGCQSKHLFSAISKTVSPLIFKLSQMNAVSACCFQLPFNVDVTKFIMLTNSWNSSDSLFTKKIAIWVSLDDNSLFQSFIQVAPYSINIMFTWRRMKNLKWTICFSCRFKLLAFKLKITTHLGFLFHSYEYI